jgi:molybdopterin-containing oxidoreductase family iron-sulfur binding subunit
VHQFVFLINDLLDAPGRTIDYLELPPASAAKDISALAEEIKAGRVETLVILGGNPVYNAPGDLSWGEIQGAVQEIVRFGCSFDETSRTATAHIAGNHYLESWGDGRTFDGTVVPVQPMISPLFEGFSELEVLAHLAGSDTTDAYTLVRETFGALSGADGSDRAFERFLSDGVLADSAFKKTGLRVDKGALRQSLAGARLSPVKVDGHALEVRIIPDNKVWDGRFSNNGWLQECPDPMTKATWDNLISISPRLAGEIGYHPSTPRSPLSKVTDLAKASAKKANDFEMGREVAPIGSLTVDGVTVSGPVHIQPGLANYTVVVALGYGRTKGGRVAHKVGFDAYPLVHTNSPAVRTGASLELTGEHHLVANTQEHWSMEGRAIIREGNQQDYEKNPDFASRMGMESHTPPVYGAHKDASLQEKVTNQFRGNSAYEIPKFGGAQQWGMSIDLNTCIGCNACVIACQSENNIPIVGKDQVSRGREMHWIRLDRYYFSGDVDINKNEIPEDPQVSLQPMLCQQCEMAPCEQVCPVNATVHDDQGLNVMAYNRCVGTRYCSNNCPYKVRRFNFFDWNKRKIGHFYEGPTGPKGMPELHKMQKNPDVTVRMRGVMEKCTFCQQRIEEAKINAKAAARDSGDVSVADGVIRTACEQACPTQAIVFGDVADASTKVSQLKSSDRDYAVLGYLNTRPRTTYLAKLRNPNPKMPDFHKMPLSRMEYEKEFGHGNQEEHEESHNVHGGAH